MKNKNFAFPYIARHNSKSEIFGKKGFVFLIVLAVLLVTSAVTVVYVATNDGPKDNEINSIKSLDGITLPENSEFVSELSDGKYLVKNDEGNYQIIGGTVDGGYEILEEVGASENLNDALQEFFDVQQVESIDGTGVSICGNAILEENEECEIGQENLCNSLDGTGTWSGLNQKSICRIDIQNNECFCKIQQTCGDSVYERQYEQCDESAADGNTCVNPQFCRACECQIPPICGNKVVEEDEECDDGNKVDNDGCSSICKKEIIPEAGYTCGIASDPLVPLLPGQTPQCSGTCPPGLTCYPNSGGIGGCACMPEDNSFSTVFSEEDCSPTKCSCGNGEPCLVLAANFKCGCGDGSSPALITK